MHFRYILLVAALVAVFMMTRGMREGYKMLKDANFQGGDILAPLVDTRQECQEQCDNLMDCKGVVMTKNKKDGKFKCWLKNDGSIRGTNRMRDNSKVTYVKDDHFAYWTDPARGEESLAAVAFDSSGKGCFAGRKVTLYEHYPGDKREGTPFDGKSYQVGCGVHAVRDLGNGLSSMKIPPGLKVRATKPFLGDWTTDPIHSVSRDFDNKITEIEVASK